MEDKTKDSKISYLQFNRELGYPIFIKCDLALFDTNLLGALNAEGQFDLLSDKEADEAETIIETKMHARVLEITEVGPQLALKVNQSHGLDQYGPECVNLRDGYQTYQYRGEALMVYSYNARAWRLGVFSHFGSRDKMFEFRSIINRFLSLALLPLGIVGFWGVPVDEGFVVQKRMESIGEAVFVDVRRQLFLTIEGSKKIPSIFYAIRLDSSLRGKDVHMNKEELVAMLLFKNTYLDPIGNPPALKAAIHEMCRYCNGFAHPRENFKPRSDKFTSF